MFGLTGSSELTETSCWRSYCNTLLKEQIPAEVGLCVVIPCTFTVPYGITVSSIVWFKCESARSCGDGYMIFHSNTSSDEVQQAFKGRVSLLESDVSQKNCSIIINDLKESDSGKYKLRVNAEPSSGSFGFDLKATVSVKGMNHSAV